MVNTSCIGSGANQIGMELSSWQACYHCGQAQGTCTAVQGGTPYDQFSSFRSNSLASVLATAGSNCSWVGNSVMTNGSAQYPVQQVACDYPAGQLSVTLQLNATAFGVIPTLPLLSLVNSGQFTWLPGSLTGNALSAHTAGFVSEDSACPVSVGLKATLSTALHGIGEKRTKIRNSLVNWVVTDQSPDELHSVWSSLHAFWTGLLAMRPTHTWLCSCVQQLLVKASLHQEPTCA